MLISLCMYLIITCPILKWAMIIRRRRYRCLSAIYSIQPIIQIHFPETHLVIFRKHIG